MQGLNLILLLVAVSTASACKYFCRTPGTFQYECCDDGNPYFTEDAAESEEDTTVAQQEETVAVADAAVAEGNTQAPSNCYYYCAYEGTVYCCGDASQPIPANHDSHEGKCPEEEDHVCKIKAIYLNPKKYQGKTYGAIKLTNDSGKAAPTCASDGYCAEEQKCCPSPCGRKHICMKALHEE